MKIKELRESDKLYADIESSIDRIKDKKERDLFWYKTTKGLTILAGGIIILLVGWVKVKESNFQTDNWVLTISLFVTLFAGLEGVFNFKDKGVNYGILLFELRRLRDRMSFDYDQDIQDYSSKKDKYFEEYQTILERQRLIVEMAGKEE